MIEFESPYYLLLILFLIPVLIIFFKNIKKIKLAYKEILYVKKIILYAKFRTLFFSLAWVFLVFAIACPLWGSKPISIRKKGVSVILVADISKSMMAEDLLPNRFAVQKQFLKILLSKLQNAFCGLIITKGESILSIPLTYEKNAITSAINNLSINTFSSYGTNLEKGVLLALNSFGENRGNSKIIVLCTDGGENQGSLLLATEAVKKSDAILIIVGFGKNEKTMLQVLDEKGETQYVDVKLDEEFLSKVAAHAGVGSMYIPALQEGSISQIFNTINSSVAGVEKMVYIQEPVKRNIEMLLISFIFICFGGLSFYEKSN